MPRSLANAKRRLATVLVADSTKFGHQSLAHLAPLEDVRHLVVDDGISSDWKRKIESAGVRLMVAPATNG